MKNHFKVVIHETGADCPKKAAEESRRFNTVIEYFDSLEDVKRYISERYGKMPKGKNKVYRDSGSEPKVVGFLHSFWNKDYSHNSKSWYQTDWISVYSIQSEPVLIV